MNSFGWKRIIRVAVFIRQPSPKMDAAFRSLCKSLCERVVLHVPCVCDLFVPYTDASGGGLV